VTEFIAGCGFVIKLGRVLFIVEKNRGGRRNRGWEEDGR